MGSLERRLGNLEARGATAQTDEEDHVSREALSRITTEDLRLVYAYLERVAGKEDGEPTEEEEAALLGYETIKEEVRGGR